jgi:hypothetical protein
VSNPILQDEPDELRELADRIFTTITGNGEVPDTANPWSDDDDIYWTVASVHSRIWPDDKAGQMIAQWRNSAGWLTATGLGGGPW